MAIDRTRLSVKVAAPHWDDATISRLISDAGGVEGRRLPEIRLVRVTAPEGGDLDAIRQRLIARPEVERAIYELSGSVRSVAPTNPLTDYQSWAKRINLFRAWETTKGDSGVIFAIVDTGLDPSSLEVGTPGYPDATGNIIVPGAFANYSPGQGGIGDVYGNPEVYGGGFSHGTFVYGLIKLAHDATQGIGGVAPGASGIMSFHANDAGGMTDMPAGFIWAANQGAKVIGCSLAGGAVQDRAPLDLHMDYPLAGDAVDLWEAIEYAMGLGCLIVAAGGNGSEFYRPGHIARIYYEGQPNEIHEYQMPAAPDIAPGACIVVSGAGGPAQDAAGHFDSPWNYNPDGTEQPHAADYAGAAQGPGVDIVAPGHSALSEMDCYNGRGPGPNYSFGGWGETDLIVANGVLVPANGPRIYDHVSTSYCQPIITGLAALILSVNPALSAAQVKQVIASTTDRGLHADWAARFPAAGMVNAGMAIAKAKATVPANAGLRFPELWFYGPGAVMDVADGATTLMLDGDIRMRAEGYSSDRVSRVEVRLGSTLIYAGLPGDLGVTASSSGTPQTLTVRAYTDSGYTEETRSDIVVSSLVVTDAPVLLVVDGSPLTASLELLTGDVVAATLSRFLLPGPLKVWNGSGLVDAALRVFDGRSLT